MGCGAIQNYKSLSLEDRTPHEFETLIRQRHCSAIALKALMSSVFAGAAMSIINYTSVDVTGASYTYIAVTGVSAAGVVVGNYGDSDGDFTGLYANDGPAVSFNVNDVVGITPNGEIYGDYPTNTVSIRRGPPA